MRMFHAAFAAALVLASAPAVAEEVIESTDVNVIVQPDGVLDVDEAITVRAEGVQIKHGIYRDFPLTILDENGDVREASFSIREITRDGRPEPYHTASVRGGVRIYVGSGDVLLDPGTHTYRMHYQIGGQLRFLADRTELFWAVTGNNWSFPILKATALFTLPDHRAPVRWAAATGSFFNWGNAFAGEITADNSLRVATTAVLPPGKGLSVILQIPDGFVSSPGLIKNRMGPARHKGASRDLDGPGAETGGAA